VSLLELTMNKYEEEVEPEILTTEATLEDNLVQRDESLETFHEEEPPNPLLHEPHSGQ